MAGIYDLVAADYPSLEAARTGFDALVAEVRRAAVHVEGVLLAEHDEQGHLRVVSTADARGRLDDGAQPGVALVLALLSGRGGDHPLPARPPGAGAVVALLDHARGTTVPPSLAGCPAELVLTLDERDVADLASGPARPVLS